MAEEWKVKKAVAHLMVVRHLLSMADERGTTHGEKHHILQVIGMELVKALYALDCTENGILFRNVPDASDEPEVSDIPF